LWLIHSKIWTSTLQKTHEGLACSREKCIALSTFVKVDSKQRPKEAFGKMTIDFAGKGVSDYYSPRSRWPALGRVCMFKHCLEDLVKNAERGHKSGVD
jgi:hypothetical protein